jgi:hypothetical protein
LEEDPVRRIALLTTAIIASFHECKIRKRKPFNPMLGETYEIVTDDLRFISEKCQHNPV